PFDRVRCGRISRRSPQSWRRQNRNQLIHAVEGLLTPFANKLDRPDNVFGRASLVDTDDETFHYGKITRLRLTDGLQIPKAPAVSGLSLCFRLGEGSARVRGELRNGERSASHLSSPRFD
ncbi:MAG TPA: hypothetical protein VFH21_07785, partial [Burkholderiales bacterium]|nr:hypothetical protein [Burkholderiales bacterium]